VSGPLIELRGIGKVYVSGQLAVRALHDVNLTIERGELLAVVGSSGSGKSTLLSILGTLERPTEGSYRFEGVEVGELAEGDLADLRNRRIGFVFQSFNLLERLTVFENVELPLRYARIRPRQRRARVEAVLAALDLPAFAGRRPAQLSGGQQQRVAIARALVANPTVILADEPTGNLDTVATGQIVSLLRQLNGIGKTVVIVTHDPQVAAAARRVVRISDGRLVGTGGDRAPSATLSRPGEEA